MQIICVGDLCCDLIVPYGRMREALRSGEFSRETAESLQVTMQCGGSVGNVARHLGRLGRHPVFLTPLRRDELGAFLSSEMENAGADMRWAAPSERSNMYCIAVLDEAGERNMFCFVPPWADFPRFDEKSFVNVPHTEEEILFTSGMAILDDGRNNAAVLDFFRARRAAGAHVVFDLNVRAESYGYEGERRRAMEEMIALSDIVLGSGEEEFFQVTGCTDIREAAAVLLDRMRKRRGPAEKASAESGDSASASAGTGTAGMDGLSGACCVVARDGGHSIYVLDAQEHAKPDDSAGKAYEPAEMRASAGKTHEPAEQGDSAGKAHEPLQPDVPGYYVDVRPVKPVSTLGAGDCFDAMFLCALAGGEGIRQAVRTASDYAGEYISAGESST